MGGIVCFGSEMKLDQSKLIRLRACVGACVNEFVHVCMRECVHACVNEYTSRVIPLIQSIYTEPSEDLQMTTLWLALSLFVLYQS